MTELTDLSDTDASNTAVTGNSTVGNVANMGGMDNLQQAILGMLSRFRNANIFRLRDNSDNTKLLALDLSGLTTATTRTLTVQDKSGTIALTDDIATQAEMETATSVVKFVTPGRQHYHPAHPKVWANVNQTGVQAIRASYGVSSITDTGTGRTQFNLATSFSGATTYAVLGTIDNATAVIVNERVAGRGVGQFEMSCLDTSFTGADTAYLMVMALGDQ